MAQSVGLNNFVPKPIPHKYEADEPAFGEVEASGPAVDYWTHLGLDRIAEYERALTAYAVERLAALSCVRVLGQPGRPGVHRFVCG